MKKTRIKLLILILLSNTILFTIIIVTFNVGISNYFINDAQKTLLNEIQTLKSNSYYSTYLSSNISYLLLDADGQLYIDEDDSFKDLLQYRKKLAAEKSEISEFCSEVEMQNGKCYQYKTDKSFFVITALNSYIDETGLIMVMYINIEPFLHYAYSINWIVFVIYICVSAVMGLIGLKIGNRIDAAHEFEIKFFQNSSHELKTPLMSIQGYAEGIQMEIQEPIKASTVILRESERMAKLVDELLYISRIDSGSLNVNFQYVDIRELIYDCIRIAEPIAEQKSCNIVPRLGDEIIYVKCDEEQMIRAISNIIVNAVYHCKTTVTILCKKHENNVKIMVHNNGDAIPFDAIEHIFDRFYTAHKGGSGIGLSIAYEVIKMHKGSIHIQNECGGTTFTIAIPLKKKGGQK